MESFDLFLRRALNPLPYITSPQFSVDLSGAVLCSRAIAPSPNLGLAPNVTETLFDEL